MADSKPDDGKEPEKKPDAADAAAGDKKPEENKDKKPDAKIGDLIKPKEGEGDKKPEPKTVGLDKFLELKNQNKKLADDMEALRKKVESGTSVEDLSDDIAALGDEFNVDKGFLSKLTKILEGRAEQKAEAKADAKLKPIAEKEERERIDKVFKKHFGEAIDEMPEYKDIADPKVIKTLSLDPDNADKTFAELIEETYGKVVGGKRTIESTKPRGGKEPQEIDFDRARKDSTYFDEIMADPESKKKYNAGIQDRLSNHL